MAVREEVALVPPNPVRVMSMVLRVVREPEPPSCALVAVYGGEIVGTLAFTQVTPGYSDQSILKDDWFQVHPAFRSRDVGPALLQEARGIADTAGKTLVVTVINPSRRRGRTERVAQLLRYEPSGAVLAFHPRT